MKKRFFVTTALVFSLLLCGTAAGGCSLFSPNKAPVEDSVQSSAVTDVSSDEDNLSDITQESIIVEESSSDQNSETAEESSEESSDSAEDSDHGEQSADFSYVSMTESEAAQASNEGYEFDDEQIVEDYHTAVTFTDNDEFNALFKDNSLDRNYNDELKNAVSVQEMRAVTTDYAQKWKDMADSAYNALSEELDEEDTEKLRESQDEWIASLAETESSFMEEAQNGGTEGLLSADTAMMNYYKGRAAKLFEQIYIHNGSIDLSSYGL